MAKIVQMTATRKLIYNTRHLVPGDDFEASSRDARVLMAIRKAKERRALVDLAPPPADVARKIAAAAVANPVQAPAAPSVPPVPPSAPAAAEGDEMKALRADYEQKVGKKPFHGWDAATLREKMADAAQS